MRLEVFGSERSNRGGASPFGTVSSLLPGGILVIVWSIVCVKVVGVKIEGLIWLSG